MSNDEVFGQGNVARKMGQPLNSNPWLGGSKREAANHLKWEMGWKQAHEYIRRQLEGVSQAA